MALTVSTLTSVAKDTAGLLDAIRALQNAGVDEKTDQLEFDALAVIEQLRAAVADADTAGSANVDQLRASLEAEKTTLQKFLDQPGLKFGERMSALARLSDVQLKLGQLIIGQTFTWNRLLSAAEIEMYEGALKEAADQVRRRKKLQSVVRSIFGVVSIGASLVSKILLL